MIESKIVAGRHRKTARDLLQARVKDLIDAALAAYQAGDSKSAIVKLRHARALDPHSDTAKSHLEIIEESVAMLRGELPDAGRAASESFPLESLPPTTEDLEMVGPAIDDGMLIDLSGMGNRQGSNDTVRLDTSWLQNDEVESLPPPPTTEESLAEDLMAVASGLDDIGSSPADEEGSEGESLDVVEGAPGRSRALAQGSEAGISKWQDSSDAAPSEAMPRSTMLGLLEPDAARQPGPREDGHRPLPNQVTRVTTVNLRSDGNWDGALGTFSKNVRIEDVHDSRATEVMRPMHEDFVTSETVELREAPLSDSEEIPSGVNGDADRQEAASEPMSVQAPSVESSTSSVPEQIDEQGAGVGDTQPMVNDPTLHGISVNSDESPIGESLDGGTPTDETPTDETEIGESPIDETPTGESPIDESPTGESLTDESFTGDSSTGDLSTGESPRRESVDGQWGPVPPVIIEEPASDGVSLSKMELFPVDAPVGQVSSQLGNPNAFAHFGHPVASWTDDAEREDTEERTADSVDPMADDSGIAYGEDDERDDAGDTEGDTDEAAITEERFFLHNEPSELDDGQIRVTEEQDSTYAEVLLAEMDSEPHVASVVAPVVAPVVTPAVASAVSSGAEVSEDPEDTVRRQIQWFIDRATEHLGNGDHAAALQAIESAMNEEPDSAAAQKAIHDRYDQVIAVFLQYLGGPEQVPTVVMSPAEYQRHVFDHRIAFLLSRIDGVLSIEELLDISGMPPLEAYRHLCHLLRNGVLTLR